VTGCPTLYWGRQPELELRDPSLDRVGYTLRTHLFTADPDVRRAQYGTLQQLRDLAASVVVVLQGEDRVLQLHHLVHHDGAEYAGRVQPYGDSSRLVTKQRLNADALLGQIHAELDAVAGSELVEWLAVNTYASWDPDDYIRTYRSFGLIVGCRLHSNLVALANGTPAVFLTYDDRTRELVRLLGVPGAEVNAFDPASIKEADWSDFVMRYRERLFPEMVSFLERNGLPHRLAITPRPVAQ
jgi:hypothetical protein